MAGGAAGRGGGVGLKTCGSESSLAKGSARGLSVTSPPSSDSVTWPGCSRDKFSSGDQGQRGWEPRDVKNDVASFLPRTSPGSIRHSQSLGGGGGG